MKYFKTMYAFLSKLRKTVVLIKIHSTTIQSKYAWLHYLVSISYLKYIVNSKELPRNSKELTAYKRQCIWRPLKGFVAQLTKFILIMRNYYSS